MLEKTLHFIDYIIFKYDKYFNYVAVTMITSAISLLVILNGMRIEIFTTDKQIAYSFFIATTPMCLGLLSVAGIIIIEILVKIVKKEKDTANKSNDT